MYIYIHLFIQFITNIYEYTYIHMYIYISTSACIICIHIIHTYRCISLFKNMLKMINANGSPTTSIAILAVALPINGSKLSNLDGFTNPNLQFQRISQVISIPPGPKETYLENTFRIMLGIQYKVHQFLL